MDELRSARDGARSNPAFAERDGSVKKNLEMPWTASGQGQGQKELADSAGNMV